VDARNRRYLHVYLNRDWLSSFEKLDGCSVVMGDDRLCNMKGICSVIVKKFDEIVRELKEVRYEPQFKMNLISVGVLKAFGLEVSIRNSVLKMTKSSMVVLKGVRYNNLYYLKGSTVTGCNAPIPRIRRRYDNVYTQSENSLTYIRQA